MLGISDTRVYLYIEKKRLRAVRAANSFMIPLDDVVNFKRNNVGRPRKSTPAWRISSGTNTQYMTSILVALRTGQRDRFLLKLEDIRGSGEHLFPGSVARYMAENDAVPGQVQIVLVWRGTVMPAEAVRQEALEDLKQELADVLDWRTAQYSFGRIFIHT